MRCAPCPPPDDPNNPKEMWKTDIGDRGTDSPALHNHKAFLYSASKKLLAIPVTLAELPADVKADPNRNGNEYGDFIFQGAYIYHLTLDKGFELLGRVTHHDNQDDFLKSGYYYGQHNNDIQRVQYSGESLVTFSDARLQLNHLYDLAEQSKVQYPQTQN